METQNPSSGTEKLTMMADDPRILNLNKADRLMMIAAVLHSSDPEKFKLLDHLTWPEGQAILIASSREAIERTNKSAQIKPILKSPYFIDVGHDNDAMKKLVEMMMRKMGCEMGIINRLTRSFTVRQRFHFDLAGV